MSFENGMFAHETMDMSLQIEACLWCVSLSFTVGNIYSLWLLEQVAQLSQRNRAAGCVI